MKSVKRRLLPFVSIFTFILISNYAYGFQNGPVLNIIGEFGGTTTVPSINDEDLAKLGANKMEGMTGTIIGVVAEAGYIFGVKEYMGFQSDAILSGVGLFGYIGVGSGYAGQVSGANIEGEQIDVYFHIHYTPVLSAGIAGKVYFFKNRLAVALSLGTKIIADLQPVYEMYSSVEIPGTLEPTVGTIIVEDWMMTKMNAFSFNFKGSIEYSIPLLDTLEVILGAYIGGNIYTPKYITMPPDLLKLAELQYGFNNQEPLESYYINSVEYGLKVGIGLKL